MSDVAHDEASAMPKLRLPHRVLPRLGQLGLRLSVPVLLVLLWWLGSQHETKGLFIAPPLDVLQRTGEDLLSGDPSKFFLGEVARNDLVPSLWRATLGFWLAMVGGVVVGIALGLQPVLTAMFQPLVHLGRSLPTPALLGVFFLLFGTGDWPKVLLIAFGIIWPILFNTIDGVRGLGMARAHVASVFQIRSRDVLLRIVLPGAAPPFGTSFISMASKR